MSIGEKKYHRHSLNSELLWKKFQIVGDLVEAASAAGSTEPAAEPKKFIQEFLCSISSFLINVLLGPEPSMSSFFTLPASQRKRKHSRSAPATSASRQRESRYNDEISGSEISADDEVDDNEASEDEDQDFEGEDPAAKRIRLAEQYLENTKEEVIEAGGFDAADVDDENLRRRLGERLKEDTAESKGKLYRWIATELDWGKADRQIIRRDGMSKSVTGIALHGKYVYAVSKDLQIVKWEVPDVTDPHNGNRASKNAKITARTHGSKKSSELQHHTRPILCLAVSPDGKFVATGGADKKLIIWDASSLKPLKVFTQHRDAVTALAFRRGTNQLFSASKDRTIKTWSLNELAYVETLFGHQDEIVDVDALAQEKCVTVGARDRTARFWKVVEESQLVFRGGGAPGTTRALQALRQAYSNQTEVDADAGKGYNEGSMDRIAMIDDDTFVTGSDNGSLSLWSVHKKKAVFTLPLAHGLDPALPLEKASAEREPDETLDEEGRGGKQPRWITALRAIPYSDSFISGSWDGFVRAWKISNDKRRIEALGVVGAAAESLDALLESESLSSLSLTNGVLQAIRTGIESQGPLNGIINDLAILDRGDKGRDGILIAAAVGKEHRLGRWKKVDNGKNCVVLYRVPRKSNTEMENGDMEDREEFSGFT